MSAWMVINARKACEGKVEQARMRLLERKWTNINGERMTSIGKYLSNSFLSGYSEMAVLKGSVHYIHPQRQGKKPKPKFSSYT